MHRNLGPEQRVLRAPALSRALPERAPHERADQGLAHPWA